MRHLSLSVCALALLASACSAPNDDPADVNGAGGSTAMSGGKGGGGTGPSGGASSSSGGSAGTPNGGASSGSGGSSGSAGDGGSGGSGGTTPHVVAPCGETGETGVWENVTPPELAGIDTPGGALVVDPVNPATLYVGTGHQGIYKSTDCAATWAHINTGTNGDKLDAGTPWDIVIDPVEHETLFAIGGYGALSLWKSTNGGVDWADLYPPESEVAQTADYTFASIVGMDPHDHLHLVVAFHGGCKGDYAPQCQAETTDGGDTWRLFKAPGSGEGSGTIVLNATTWVFGLDAGMQQTTDSGATWYLGSAGHMPHWQSYRTPDGVTYVGMQNGMIKTSNDQDWEALPSFDNSAQGITGDGTYVYAGQQWGSHVYKIPIADPASWTELPTTDGDDTGPYMMGYDPDHKILYGAEFVDGYWRMVLE